MTDYAPDTIFITIDRCITGEAEWIVTVQDLANPFDDEIRRELAADAEQRDGIVNALTAEHEQAGRPVVVIQPRTPAAYHDVPAMALRDYAPAPR